MDEDEDDFYGGNGDQDMFGQDASNNIKKEDVVMSEDEEEDSDDDVQFTLEKPEVVKAETSQTKPASKAIPVEKSSSQSAKARQTETPATTKKQENGEHIPQASELLHNGKEGKDYPEYRSSNIDLDADPTWPADGKKITEVDIDADLAEHSKPWRLPGTDVTDFFNYGFDEYTWVQYCAKQQSMSDTINGLKDEDAKLKSMLGGMPDMSGGMPDMNAMMQMMMSNMGGMDPTAPPDFSQMMQMGMPPGAQAGFGGPMGNNSPLPQAGQGFQPPFGGPGMQNDFNPQQMMQQDQLQAPQQQYVGQGGNRGRGRKGRGHY